MRKRRLFFVFVGIALVVTVGGLWLDSQYVVPILMYHSIDQNAVKTKLSVTPESFARQMEFLYKNNYNVVSLDEVVRLIKSGKRIPRNTVAITFDDSFENNFTEAFPVLKKYGLPATFFVIPRHAGKKGCLNWDQMRQMAQDGMLIGSHTLDDVWLPGFKEERLKNQISGSKEILEAKIGREVNFISYPLGGFDRRVIDAVKAAGYKGACATNPGRKYPKHDVYALKRIRISRTSDNLFVFWIESSGFYTLIKEIRDED